MIKVSRQRFIVLCVINISLLLVSLLVPNSTMITLVFVIWLDGVAFTLEDLHEKGALFGFLMSFFLLLIGAELLERFGLHEVESEFPNEVNLHAEFLLLISLIVLFIGYAVSGKVKIGNSPRDRIERDYHSRIYMTVQEVSKALFFLTFAFNIITVMDIVLFVVRHGYIMFYTSYVSSVPYVIKKIGDMCLICFWIFLATMPEKKKVDRLSLFCLFYFLLTLGTGKRFPFVAGILTLFIYYVARNSINSGGETWIKRKTIIALVFIAAPLALWTLYIIGEVRIGRTAEALRIDKALISFFYDQGGSINVIKRAEIFASRLPEKSYLFGSTYEAISNNVIFRLLGFKQYAGNTVEHAVSGYSFQHALSYITMGSYYLAGHGLGSCYIAEAYHDLGYVGVVLVNLIYGFIFRKLFDFGKHGIWATAIILSMLYSLLLAPRGSADGFITDIVDLTTWGSILVVWIISKLVLSHGRPVRVYGSVNEP